MIPAEHSRAASDEEVCYLIGEISVEAVKWGATWKCLTTGNPVACTIAAALNDSATDYLVRQGVTAGCEWSVDVGRRMLRLSVKTAKMEADEFKEVYNALNTIEGIRWLEKKLQ